jgi:hypothetical protein
MLIRPLIEVNHRHLVQQQLSLPVHASRSKGSFKWKLQACSPPRTGEWGDLNDGTVVLTVLWQHLPLCLNYGGEQYPDALPIRCQTPWCTYKYKPTTASLALPERRAAGADKVHKGRFAAFILQATHLWLAASSPCCHTLEVTGNAGHHTSQALLSQMCLVVPCTTHDHFTLRKPLPGILASRTLVHCTWHVMPAP